MRKAIIFDMDGVIVDSELHWKKAELPFFKKIIPGWTGKNHQEIIGMNIEDIYAKIKKEFDVKITKEEYLKKYHETAEQIYWKKTLLLPNFMEFISMLKQAKYTTAIASSSPRSWIEIVTTRFELKELFDKIVSAEDVECRGKPAPDIYLHTAKQLGKNPNQCIVIEDSKNGVISAKKAGMHCIGIRNGFNQEQNLSQADRIISGFDELKLEDLEQM